MSKGFLTLTDAGLLAWSNNFSTLISSSPTTYGLSAANATDYAARHAVYAAAYTAAVDPITRTRGAVAAKNDARELLKKDARLLASIVQGQATVTNEQKINLGLTVRDIQPSPIPAPVYAPLLSVVAVVGHTVKLKLRDSQNESSRGKPAGVQGATVMSYTGESAPANLDDWKFEANVTQSKFDVAFDPALPAGSTVFFTAFWYAPRGLSGPACDVVTTTLGAGVSAAA